MIDFDSSGANEPERNGAAEPAVAVRRSAASALLSSVQIWSMPTSDPQAAAPAEIPASAEAPAPEASAQTKRARPSQLLAEARHFSSSARRIQDLTPAPEPAEPTTDLSVEFRRRLKEARHT